MIMIEGLVNVHYVFCPISIGQGNSPISSPFSSWEVSTPILLEPLELRLQQINQ